MNVNHIRFQSMKKRYKHLQYSTVTPKNALCANFPFTFIVQPVLENNILEPTFLPH